MQPTKAEMDAVVWLADLAMQLGRVNRVTFHPDGVMPESDTTHTVMLNLVACAWADKYTDMDVGLISQFVSVHDLPEALVGDTNTIQISAEAMVDKEWREAAAAHEIAEASTELPWVGRMLKRYEAQDCREARFVRVVDKVLPKITHALNGAATLRLQGLDLGTFGALDRSRCDKIGQTYGADQPAAMDLLMAAHEYLVEILRNLPTS